jgi:hypothetical protein
MQGSEPATFPPFWRLRWLLAIVVIMAVLAAGWPLVNAGISGAQPLAAGRTLTIGPDAMHSARITVGPGWVLVTSQSNPLQDYLLRRNRTNLVVNYVTLTGSPGAAKLWSGLRRIVRISNASARLGAATTMRNSRGLKGLTGRQALSDGRTGIAVIFPAPGGKFAIEITAVAKPGATAADLAAARRVAESVFFPEVSR